ncbi:chemotaxis protein CheX [Geomesophilobacter sediminis]|uniref:Chemotaxis protein CheX n=1 Tax=Geomesophilobacter sediminis TaxID=2798584 RepID=A0A8J7J9D5_9BACT|nr:chemotaxis protein CheX [Geomesophilobacter sediminis]MBJ6726476.1 chemotaxis protein CheX [Geomesophilobacter sediminis]
MAVKFFGQFLLEKGVVSREAIIKAVELQESVNLKFGETALELKLLTEKDIKKIHDAQRSEDLMLGDMAVKLGILTKDQISQILEHQQKSHLRIGEALVRVGALTAEELPGYLKEFSADQAKYATSRIVIPAEVPNAAVWEICADLTAKMFIRVVGVQCRLGDCMLVDKIPGNALIAGIDLAGGVSARYHLAVSDSLREKIAKGVLMEEDVAGESEAVLDDTVLEFVNIVCGNVAAKAAQQGQDVEILPPLSQRPGPEGLPVPSGSVAVFFPLHLPDSERAELTLVVRR